MRAPTIKGMFVNSHVKAVKTAKGEKGVRALARKFGKPLRFGNLDNIPVREEVRLIECALDVLFPNIKKGKRSFEAGRLHFRNFSQTPFGRVMFRALPRDFKKLIMRSKYIAQHVFRNVTFSSVDRGPKSALVIMENNDYPLDHFKGLFYEWLRYFGLKGNVRAKAVTPTRYEYKMTWK